MPPTTAVNKKPCKKPCLESTCLGLNEARGHHFNNDLSGPCQQALLSTAEILAMHACALLAPRHLALLPLYELIHAGGYERHVALACEDVIDKE